MVYFCKFNPSFFIVLKWLFPKSQMSFWPHFRPSGHLNSLYLLNCFWQCFHKDKFSRLLRFSSLLECSPIISEFSHSLKYVQLAFSLKWFQSLTSLSLFVTIPFPSHCRLAPVNDLSTKWNDQVPSLSCKSSYTVSDLKELMLSLTSYFSFPRISTLRPNFGQRTCGYTCMCML